MEGILRELKLLPAQSVIDASVPRETVFRLDPDLTNNSTCSLSPGGFLCGGSGGGDPGPRTTLKCGCDRRSAAPQPDQQSNSLQEDILRENPSLPTSRV